MTDLVTQNYKRSVTLFLNGISVMTDLSDLDIPFYNSLGEKRVKEGFRYDFMYKRFAKKVGQVGQVGQHPGIIDE